MLGLSEGGSVDVGVGHPLHDALSDTVALRSALFTDSDGDGEVSALERADGPLASGEGREEDVADTGGAEGFDPPDSACGCQEEVYSNAAWVLFLPLFGWRRRRRRSPGEAPDRWAARSPR